MLPDSAYSAISSLCRHLLCTILSPRYSAANPSRLYSDVETPDVSSCTRSEPSYRIVMPHHHEQPWATSARSSFESTATARPHLRRAMSGGRCRVRTIWILTPHDAINLFQIRTARQTLSLPREFWMKHVGFSWQGSTLLIPGTHHPSSFRWFAVVAKQRRMGGRCWLTSRSPRLC
jgi:hypothetical protein